MKEIGERLKQIREEKRMSPPELARKIDTNKQNIYNWEDGVNDPNDASLKKNIVPSAENLIAICRTLGVNIHWLLTGEGEKYIEDSEKLEKAKTFDDKMMEIKDMEIDHLKQVIVFLKGEVRRLGGK